MKYALILSLIAGPVVSGPFDVHDTARSLFDRLPDVQEPADFKEQCGMGGNSNPHIGFCTTQNLIFVSDGFAMSAAASYEMAHVLGHAIQVRHGVADVALRAIRTRPDDEDALRGMVTRQVECIAGVLMASANEPFISLTDQFEDEPFTDAHWGRSPLNSGPRVSIGLDARAQWYRVGYDARDVAACAVGDMSADLLVAAQR